MVNDHIALPGVHQCTVHCGIVVVSLLFVGVFWEKRQFLVVYLMTVCKCFYQRLFLFNLLNFLSSLFCCGVQDDRDDVDFLDLGKLAQ